MTHKFWFRAVPVVCCAVFALVIFGCAGWAAGNTTKIVQSQNEVTPVTYAPIPPELLGATDPNNPLYGKVVWVPTVPNKDVDFESYYPTGQLMYKLKTSKSGPMSVQWQGVVTADDAKFLQDRTLFAMAIEEINTLVGELKSFYAMQTQAKQAAAAAQPAGDGGCNQATLAAIGQLIEQKLAGLKK